MSNQAKIELNEFIAELKRKGVTTSSHYYVHIPNFGTRYDLSLCESAQLPGYNIGQSEVRMYGEFVEMPYATMYANLQLTFLTDSSMATKKAIEDWMAEVVNPKTRAVGYYEDYTRAVDIFVTDKKGKIIYAVRLNECWPKAMGDAQLSYTSADVIRVPVTLVFKWWEKLEVDEDGNPVDSDNARILASINQQQNPEFTSGGDLQENTTEYAQPETQGSTTGVTRTGTITRGLAGNTPLDFAPSTLSKDLTVYGNTNNLAFSKASNSVVTAFGAQDMPSNFAQEMITSSKSISRSMGNYGQSITQLGGNLMNATQPIAGIVTSIGSLANTLGAINNVFSIYGLGSPFQGVIGKFANTASALSQVSQLAGLPQHLTTIGANMSATGAIFSQQIPQISQMSGYTPAVGTAIQGMANTFNSTGSSQQNAAAAVSAYVDGGY